ncbi:MAG: DUF6600 domain-containing protein [Casimicrobiaceae bacterium]
MNQRLSPVRSPLRWLAVAALVLSPALALADPPSRVARLALVEGAVSFSPAGVDDWFRANINRPLVTGDRLWADSDARIEIQLAGATARLGARTNVTILNLDDRIQQFQLTEGTLYVRVRGLDRGEEIEIDTPSFAFVATRPGIYRFEVDPERGASTVYVRRGEGDVYGDGAAYRVESGQSIRFRGTDLRDAVALGVAPPDTFERWAQGRDARYERLPSARYVAPDVIGYEDLDAYGTWRAVANVGNVWIPRTVPAGWAPYRNGHWTWIDPWGWTWVDDAPWGFAPFHYGRWTQIDDRWGWVPGPVRERPVYAPALVAFIGGANFSVSASSGPAIGWFPLGPGEVYRPGYDVSRDYFTRVNVTNTVVSTSFVTNIYNNRDRVADVRYENFSRPAAITAVAPAVFVQSQPVQRAAFVVDRRVLDKAEVIPLAKVAPQRESVTGARPAAQAAPPAAMQQPAVAKAPPPPAPPSLESRLPALRSAPGKPFERPAGDATRTGAPPPAAASPASPPARVVTGGDPKPLPAQMQRGNADAPRGDNAKGPPEQGPRENARGQSPGQPSERATSPQTAPPVQGDRGPQTQPPVQGERNPQPQPPNERARDAQTQPPNARGNAPQPPAAPVQSPAERTRPPQAQPPNDRAADPQQQDRVKGPPPRDTRGPPSQSPQTGAPDSRQTPPPQSSQPPQAQPQPQAQPRPAPGQQPPARADVAPPPTPQQPAAPAPAMRAEEPRGRGNANGPPSRGDEARGQRAPAPSAAPPAAPTVTPPPAPPAATPAAPPAPPAAPRAAPPVAAPAPPPAPAQVAPNAPPQADPAAQGGDDKGKGKGKGKGKNKDDDDDKKP